MPATAADVATLTTLLGREPRGDFDIVVRDEAGAPVVIRNAPLLADGTPMPTRFWLVDPDLVARVSRLESAGGVKAAEAAVDGAALARAHEQYAPERDAALPAGHAGPRPFGGVAGTARGVKCLHAHYAYSLSGGDDPVGAWVAHCLAEAAP
jgi:hypothetical protein